MTNEEILVSTAVASWKLTVGRFTHAISSLTDEQLQRQVAPGRNRLMYLLGHLTAVHDRLLPMLGLGERMFPELDVAYITNPDATFVDPFSGSELTAAWAEVNNRLTTAFEALTAEEWLQKHTAVSDEDFVKDPLRNRLAVVLSRTNHVGFHAGQAVLALEKK